MGFHKLSIAEIHCIVVEATVTRIFLGEGRKGKEGEDILKC